MPISQDNVAVKKPQFIHSFQRVNITGTDGTLNAAADTNVVVTQKVMPYPGSVYAMAINASGTLASGTLSVYPTINGATLTNLEVELGIPGDQYDYTIGEGRVYNFVAGDRLGVVFINDSVSPDNDRDIVADVYTVAEGVEL